MVTQRINVSAPGVSRANNIPVQPISISHILSRFDRTQLEGFVAIAIDLMDLADGDADIEANGDELDGTAGEDDFYPHSNWRGEPGCPISDPDKGVDDEPHGDREWEPYGHEFSEPEVRVMQRTRIRKTRCHPQYRQYRGWSDGAMKTEVVKYHLRAFPSVPSRRQLLTRKRGMPKRPRA